MAEWRTTPRVKPVETFYVIRKELKTGIAMMIGHNGLDQYAFVPKGDAKIMAFPYETAKNMMDLLMDNHKTYCCWSLNRHIPNYEFSMEPKCD